MVSRTLLYAALAVVGVVVVWAFALVGGPSFNRKVAADNQRIEDLRRLSRGVDIYFAEHKRLPEKLSDVGDEEVLKGRTTAKPYEYAITGAYSYRLCADFELSSKEAELEKERWGYMGERNWSHDAGNHCFYFDIPEGKRASDTTTKIGIG